MASYEQVKAFRKRRKKYIVDSLGGACGICGYDKCSAAFDIHHIDESEKSFDISGKMSKKWSELVAELRKCVLLCANCHRELHHGIASLPLNIKRFDESFSEYALPNEAYSPNSKRSKRKLTYCPICGNKKISRNNTCSKKCMLEREAKKWSSIDLESLLNTHSRESIGRMIGVSGNSVLKRSKKLGYL